MNRNETVCRICHAGPLEFLFTAKDTNRRVDDQNFRIYYCRTCQVGQTFPLLSDEELARYYPREYYSIDDTFRMEAAQQARQHRLSRVQRIRRYVESGRLLDVGSGTGMFLKTARESGFTVKGLELSTEAGEFGKTQWNLDIVQGDLNKTTLPSEFFDVVTLGHVFEHLEEPLEAAKKLHAWTRTGGLLVVAVPNFQSLQARLFREHWYHLDVPRHRYHYSPSSLTSILENAGFKTLEINNTSAEHNWAGVLGSMMRLSPPGESTLHKSVRKLVGTPVAKLAVHIEEQFGSGGTFEVYATRV